MSGAVGVPPAPLDWALEQRTATDEIALIPAIDDPRLYDVYLRRARARWNLADTAERIRGDLEAAGRCARSQGGSRLIKIEPTRLRTRRLDPLHLALLVPDPVFVESMGNTFGLPLIAFYAKTATSDVLVELRGMSSAFRTGAIDGPADLTGLAAATYAAALGQLAAGDKAGARAVLKKLERALDGVPDGLEPPAAGRRLLQGCAALAAIAGRQLDSLQGALQALVPSGTAPAEPDLLLLALIGLAMLETLAVDVAGLGLDGRSAALADGVVAAWLTVD